MQRRSAGQSLSHEVIRHMIRNRHRLPPFGTFRPGGSMKGLVRQVGVQYCNQGGKHIWMAKISTSVMMNGGGGLHLQQATKPLPRRKLFQTKRPVGVLEPIQENCTKITDMIKNIPKNIHMYFSSLSFSL
ncbi:hypothetical protein BVC80_1823g9 [Macleaya cordata]|uniref:Uncharacterized protein n=1 Tax=Macleaya cordata TaxID=56857 RepID=A0A200QZR6_MACCD|nr:hypothetical protein BVC80_1823g9 [Macleaya cordata]